MTPIKNKPFWFAATVINGRLDIELEIEYGNNIGENQALLQFQFVNDAVDYSSFGIKKSHREEVGYYIYLQTQPGRHRQTLSFAIPITQDQVLLGLRAWYADDIINLISLSEVPPRRHTNTDEALDILLSVDVEALPGRAPDHLVDRLIWGGSHSESGHGVGRLAKIFNDKSVKATFYVDFAACCIHGDAGISEAAQYLVAHGQDVQLHVHSEVLVRDQQWIHDTNAIPTFALHSFSTARRAIEYAEKKYTKYLGCKPYIFRAGGLWWSTDSILATGAIGIQASSNVSPTRPFWPSSDIFRWENGTVEMPVDFCLDPYIQKGCENLLTDIEVILSGKTQNVISCYMHSWSLSPRTSEGYHLQLSTRYQANLEEAIDILKSIGSLHTSSSEYLKDVCIRTSLKSVPLTWGEKNLNVKSKPEKLLNDQACCNICNVILIKSRLKNDVCTCCKLRQDIGY